MNTKVLTSLSLIALFGLTACSTNPRNSQPSEATPTGKVQANQNLASSQRVPQGTTPKSSSTTNPYQQRWAAQQNALKVQKEQQRLTYNQNWQNQQQRLEQQKANEQAKIAAQAHSRNVWQEQQAREAARQQAANQLAQQQAMQQRAIQQRAAQQQAAQQYALQQRNSQNSQQNQPNGGGIASLSGSEMRAIGDKIFRNESGGDIDKLVHWNVGEDFASMGIGHFTWYPSGRRNRFGNTFPGLLDHLQTNGVNLPVWVQKARHTGAPWRTKGELNNAKRNGDVQEFQNLLYQTRHLQAGYIFERAKRAMPRLVKTTPAHLQGHVAQNLNAVANTPGGWYALIDYVNFKGEGLNRSGGYKGQNWGLLQVLENMRPSQPGQGALNNFADSAIQTLERRVRNSNPSRNEARWLRGWTIRLNTYRQPFVI